MSLEDWVRNGWIKTHETSKKEIRNLFLLADRDISDASAGNISNDRKFNIAYSATLHLCQIPLHCLGYRISRGEGHHFRAIQSITLTMGKDYSEKKNYFDDCRVKRNKSDYDMVGTISEDEVREILEEAKAFRQEIWSWVQYSYPQYDPF